MISREEVENLAGLARLQLTDAEIEGLQKDISNILDYVSQVAGVEFDKAAAPAAPALRNVLRADEPRAAGDALWGKEEAVRAGFPRSEGDFNVVRKIIQKDE